MTPPHDPQGEQPIPDAILDAFREAFEAGDIGRAEEAAMALMAEAGRNPDAWTSEDLLLKAEARRLEEAADWAGAEAAYGEALCLARRQSDDALVFKALLDLCNLHRLLGQHDRALCRALEAGKAAECADLTVLRAMAAEAEARCHLSLHDHASSLVAATDALNHLAPDGIHDLQRARLLNARALALLADGRVREAELELDAAWALLEPVSEPSLLAGIQASVAGYWEARARVRAHMGEALGAAAAWREAVQRRRTVAAGPCCGPFRRAALAEALREASAALAHIGESAPAEEAAAESRRIREELGLAG